MNNIIEHNGKKYMNVKSAAQLWGVSSNTVRKYCREKRIQDSFKLSERTWYISIDSIKPLSEKDVHRILVLSLQLKNNPSYEIDWDTLDFSASEVRRVYKQLYNDGYIQSITSQDDKKIPYEVILTQKGFDIATSFAKNESKKMGDVITQWGTLIVGIFQLSLQLYNSFS